MNILQLCLRIPYPLVDGGNIAMTNLARCLVANNHTVSMLALNTKKHFIEAERIPDEFYNQYHLKSLYIDTTVTTSGVIANLFSNNSLNIIRFYSNKFTDLLKNELTVHEFDLIILESLFMACYIDDIRKHTNIPLVIHAHNVEYIIWQRLHQTAKNPLKKAYFKLLYKRIQKFEQFACNKVDAIIALTQNDAAIFKSITQKPVFEIPIGIDVASYAESKTAGTEKIKLFHLGSMDWIPNRDAITWFLEHVWNVLDKTEPNLELHIAGRNMPDSFFSRADEKLKVYGLIENAREFVSSKDIMIVPLFAGSGMRVKIIEGMASGKCIVSTTIGAEGIKYTNGHDIFIANTPAEFIETIRILTQNKQRIAETGIKAKQTALKHYDNRVIGETVTKHLNSVLNN